MDIEKERKFIKNAVFKAVDFDETVRLDCEDDYEFEFYSMYDAIVRDLWVRTCRSFDSYDQFLEYCKDCRSTALYRYI